MVPPESPVRGPADLAGVPVGVGYHSGSHFATAQALEAVLAPEQATLTFQGPPNERLDALLDRQVPAATLFGIPLYIAEVFAATQAWTRRVFPALPEPAPYDEAVLS
jgi:NitT/TauT family transport system substrate-binding protein